MFDHINHHHVPGVDPISPGYDPSKAEEHMEVFRQCYMAADRMLGTLLDGLDENSCVLVVSDHGMVPDVRCINFRKFLYEKGFLVLKDPSRGLDRDEAPDDNIDWEKARVFMKPGRCFDIFINAPQGSDQYARTQNELLTALRSWVDEGTGRCPIAVALPKHHAALLGFWGDQCGDVVFFMESGYVHGYMGEWRGIKGGGYLGEPEWYGAHHGPQFPTTRTSVSSNMAFFLAWGPGIKKGYQRPTNELGYIHMTSVAPLVCHLLGMERPAQAQGPVPRDVLEGHAAAMERRTDYPEWEPGTGPQGYGDRVWVQKDMFDFVSHEDREAGAAEQEAE